MRWNFGSLSLEGESRGGDRTWFRVQPPGIAFDAGRGALPLAGTRHLFISHGHLDHCLGVPFILSYRARHGGEPTVVVCPRPVAGRLEALIESASRLEEHDYHYEVHGFEPGDEMVVGSYRVVAFPTDHVVPSLGYKLVRGRRRLRPRFEGLPSEELKALRERGMEIEHRVEETWLAYCGDTGRGIFDLAPEIGESEVLVIECTFLDPAHRDKAREFGHLHFEDLVEHRDLFDNRHLVLCHLSRRHSEGELRREVEARLPELASRVVLAVA